MSANQQTDPYSLGSSDPAPLFTEAGEFNDAGIEYQADQTSYNGASADAGASYERDQHDWQPQAPGAPESYDMGSDPENEPNYEAGTAPDTGHQHLDYSALLDTGSLSLNRMPVLHMIMERLSSNCADHMRHLAPTPMYFNMADLSSLQSHDVLANIEQNGLAAIFHAPEWETSIIIALDRAFIYTTIESMFGGDGTEPETVDRRPFSPIELRVTQNLVKNIARALESAFSNVAPVNLRFERIEYRMDFASIGGRSNQVVVGHFKQQALNRTGEMFVLIPQSVIASMRNVLARPVSNDPVVRDPTWANQIQAEVQKASINLQAILGETEMTLGELAHLKPGSIITLDKPARRDLYGEKGVLPAKIATDDHELFWCQLGQSQDAQIVLQVLEPVEDVNKEIQDFLSQQ